MKTKITIVLILLSSILSCDKKETTIKMNLTAICWANYPWTDVENCFRPTHLDESIEIHLETEEITFINSFTGRSSTHSYSGDKINLHGLTIGAKGMGIGGQTIILSLPDTVKIIDPSLSTDYVLLYLNN